MGASFDETKSRIIKSTTKQDTNTFLGPEPRDNYDVKYYLEPRDKKQSTTELNKGDVFEMLETKSKPVINFSNCKLNDSWDRCALTKDIDEKPVVKKRKLQIVQIKFDASQPSTSTDFSSTHSEAQPFIRSDPGSKKVVNSDKTAIGTAYLKNVRIYTASSELYFLHFILKFPHDFLS